LATRQDGEAPRKKNQNKKKQKKAKKQKKQQTQNICQVPGGVGRPLGRKASKKRGGNMTSKQTLSVKERVKEETISSGRQKKRGNCQVQRRKDQRKWG